MKLPVGKKIKERRKTAGMGQEALAALLGVSAAAVSKWECGKAYPDITLLPAIAKHLQTDINDLFGQPRSLTEPQIEQITRLCGETIAAGEIGAGLAQMQDALGQYPNDTGLMLGFAAMLTTHSMLCAAEEKNLLLEKATGLCLEAQRKAVHKTAASRLLTNLYILRREYGLAEESLNCCTDQDSMEANRTLAILALAKGELEDAKKRYQTNLFNGILECDLALTGLSQIAARQKKEEAYLRLTNTNFRMHQLFQLDLLPGKSMNMHAELAHYYGQNEKPEEMMEELAKMLQGVPHWNSEYEFSQSEFFYLLPSAQTSLSKSIKKEVVSQILQGFEAYSIIKERPDYKKWRAGLEKAMAEIQ